MKITAIRVYKTPLPYVDGIYKWGAGNAIEIAQASVVEIETDAGLIGVGEFTPCGENYIEGYSEGVEAAARMLAPQLLGQDPRQVYAIERIMDNTILGHAYAKSPFDNACWDILPATGQPLDAVGRQINRWRANVSCCPTSPPNEMKVQMERLRDRGYSQFQIKVGADYISDIERIKQTVPHLKPGRKPLPMPIKAGQLIKPSALPKPQKIWISSLSSPAKPMRNASKCGGGSTIL